MNRKMRATLAQETLYILEAGQYTAPSGRTVALVDALTEAVESTRLYQPSDFPSNLTADLIQNAQPVRIMVTPESTLEAAQRLAREYPAAVPLCLNFASAKNTGGGFLGGSQAQEETLARSSGLYRCLSPIQTFYNYHIQQRSCLYSDRMIYSPRVPVFRDDMGNLLEESYLSSFLSVSAPNAGAIRQNEPGNICKIEPTLRERIRRLLWVAHTQGHGIVILGAWGCGVFQNDPNLVARLFAELLAFGGEFHYAFNEVIFAVYDRTSDQNTLKAFLTRLA